MDGILPFARKLLEKVVGNGDIAIDATAGNGHDTLFLAKLVGQNGRVFSFDVQKEAINKTQQRLANHNELEQVTLINDGHEKVKEYLNKDNIEKVKGAIFNLGYLPGGDKTIVTMPDTTKSAIENIFDILSPGGIIVLVIYHGHDEGKKERDAILEYTASIEQETAYVLKYEFVNQRNNPPFIVAIEKRS